MPHETVTIPRAPAELTRSGAVVAVVATRALLEYTARLGARLIEWLRTPGDLVFVRGRTARDDCGHPSRSY